MKDPLEYLSALPFVDRRDERAIDRVVGAAAFVGGIGGAIIVKPAGLAVGLIVAVALELGASPLVAHLIRSLTWGVLILALVKIAAVFARTQDQKSGTKTDE